MQFFLQHRKRGDLGRRVKGRGQGKGETTSLFRKTIITITASTTQRPNYCDILTKLRFLSLTITKGSKLFVG